MQCTKMSPEFESGGSGTENEKVLRFSGAVLGARVMSSASSTPVGKSAHAV